MLRGLELNTSRRDDVVAESIYTAAVWQTVAKAVSEHRMLPDVYKVKAVYCVGIGIGIDTPDQPSLQEPVDLCARTDGGPVTSQLLCEPNDVLDQLVHPPSRDFVWAEGDVGQLIAKQLIRNCSLMLHDWHPRIPRGSVMSPFHADLGYFRERCQIAVNMAIPAMTVYDRPGLVAPWINHRSKATLKELHDANLGVECLLTPVN